MAGEALRALTTLLDTPEDRARVQKSSRAYFDVWIADKVPPIVRKAQARDYRKHVAGYVLPRLGRVTLKDLSPRDILGLRAELL